MSCGSNTSHTHSPQMLGQEQGKLLFVLLSTSPSLQLAAAPPQNLWDSNTRRVPISHAGWNFSHCHSPTHLNSLLPIYFFHSFQASWQVSFSFLVLQLLPHSTWTAEPSHKIRVMNNVHRLLRCICFPLPGLQHDWRGTSTDSWTNPTLSQRTGTAAQPGSLLKHGSLLFHIRGLYPSNWRSWPHLRSKPAKKPWSTGIPNTAKGNVPLLGPPQKGYSSHHAINIHCQIWWQRHRMGKGQAFPTRAVFSSISSWNQWPASVCLSRLELDCFLLKIKKYTCVICVILHIR